MENDKYDVAWHKIFLLTFALLNSFAFITGTVYLTIMQGYFLEESFLGWSFSAEDAFFRGWLLFLTEYTWLFLLVVFLPVLYGVFGIYQQGEFVGFYPSLRRTLRSIAFWGHRVISHKMQHQEILINNQKTTVKRKIALERLKKRFLKKYSDKSAVYGFIMIFSLLVFIYILPFILSSAYHAERDADVIKWSAIGCQTVPSQNCYCYSRIVKDSKEKHGLLGALLYKDSDSIWLLDDKGLLHMLSAKDYELSKVSDKKFELD